MCVCKTLSYFFKKTLDFLYFHRRTQLFFLNFFVFAMRKVWESVWRKVWQTQTSGGGCNNHVPVGRELKWSTLPVGRWTNKCVHMCLLNGFTHALVCKQTHTRICNICINVWCMQVCASSESCLRMEESVWRCFKHRPRLWVTTACWYQSVLLSAYANTCMCKMMQHMPAIQICWKSQRKKSHFRILREQHSGWMNES